MNSPVKANRFMLGLLIYLMIAPYVILILKMIFFNDMQMITILLIQPIILFIIPVLIYMLFSRKHIYEIIPIKKLSLKNSILIFLMSIFAQPIISVVSAITSFFTNNNASDILTQLSDNPYYLMILAVAVLPAICEETVFRGVILTGYKRTGVLKASLVTGLFFGIMHLDLHQFFYATIIGVFFGYLVYYTNSIFSTILSHFVINASQISMLYVSKMIYTTEEIIQEQQQFGFEENLLALKQTCIMAIVALPIFILLFRAFIRNNKKLNVDFMNYITDKKLKDNDYDNDNNSVIKHNNKIVTVSFIIIIVLYLFNIISSILVSRYM